MFKSLQISGISLLFSNIYFNFSNVTDKEIYGIHKLWFDGWLRPIVIKKHKNCTSKFTLSRQIQAELDYRLTEVAGEVLV